MLSALGKAFSRMMTIFIHIILFFLEKRFWHSMQSVSNGDNLHEMSNHVFWEKLKREAHGPLCSPELTCKQVRLCSLNFCIQNLHSVLSKLFSQYLNFDISCLLFMFKTGQGQPMVTIWINLAGPDSPVLHTKFQGLHPFVRRENFQRFFIIYGHGQNHMNKLSFPHPTGGSTCNLVSISPAILEEEIKILNLRHPGQRSCKCKWPWPLVKTWQLLSCHSFCFEETVLKNGCGVFILNIQPEHICRPI